jgi:hypothetical protein
MSVLSAFRTFRTPVPNDPWGMVCALAFPSKMALKEFPRPALAIFAEHYRLRLRPRVGDVPLRMRAFHRFPVGATSMHASAPPASATARPEPSRRLSRGCTPWSRSRYDPILIAPCERRLSRAAPLPPVEGSINPIVDCRSDALSGSRVLFRCLNRDMAEQKLDLIQFTACVPAEPSTGSAQIVRCKGRDTDFRSGRPYHMPYCLFADAIPEHATCSADTAKHLPTIDGW